MGNVKKQLQDYYDRVVQLDGLEQQLEMADDVSQLKRFINYKMKPKHQSDKNWCDAIATEIWNDHWSKYNDVSY
tara:strand:- start:185 stop:406 length:222 start_codon:yes stop_codon:yes gene_type:complete